MLSVSTVARIVEGLGSGHAACEPRNHDSTWARPGIPTVFWLRLTGFAECACRAARHRARKNQMSDWTKQFTCSIRTAETTPYS